ncbi:diguanylate cyclase domain-containing protein [Methylobacterium sp. JK268]
MKSKVATETERLALLRDLKIVGSAPEPHFDAVCRTAAALFGVPVALVSLVEADRLWFKARCGLPAEETPRALSFCAHTIQSDELFVVEDAAADARFADSPLVTGTPPMRFYAGAPLVLRPGLRLGTLCVIDAQPRAFTAQDRARLADLAAMVTAHLRLHHAEQTLRTSEAQFRLLAECATDMIVLADADATRRYVSPAARALLGYAPEELVGTRAVEDVHPEDAEAYRLLMGRMMRGELERGVRQQRLRRKDGRYVWVEATFGVTRDTAGAPTGTVAALRDISERKEAESRIAHLALHDPLTGLPNRLHFRDRLLQELALVQRYGGAFALLCLDLDRFKEVNDRLGHAAGDALLCAVAERIRRTVRTEDTAARIGGDEFVVLQTRTAQVENARALAQRLIATLQAPFDLGEHGPASVGASIGIALAPRDGDDAGALYRLADQALYAAKAAGRGRLRFVPSAGERPES